MELEYKEIILELVARFKLSIPTNEEELAKEFEEYLYSTVKNLENSTNKFVRKDKKSIEDVLKSVTDNLCNLDLELKKQELLFDNNFKKIGEISNTFFELAKFVFEGEEMNIEINAQEKIDEMEKLLSLVEPYNKEEAERLLSEAILDLKFIENPRSNISSIRLGHLIRLKTEKGEGR